MRNPVCGGHGNHRSQEKSGLSGTGNTWGDGCHLPEKPSRTVLARCGLGKQRGGPGHEQRLTYWLSHLHLCGLQKFTSLLCVQFPPLSSSLHFPQMTMISSIPRACLQCDPPPRRMWGPCPLPLTLGRVVTHLS